MSRNKLPSLFDPHAYTFYSLTRVEVEKSLPPDHGKQPLKWHIEISKNPEQDVTTGEVVTLSDVFGFRQSDAQAMIEASKDAKVLIYPGTHEICEAMCYQAQTRANELYEQGHVFRAMSINMVAFG